MASQEKIDEAKTALTRVQEFSSGSLARVDDLGKQLNFSEAVPYAKAIIDLYRRVPVSTLDDFSENQLNEIINASRSDYGLFDQIMNWKADIDNAIGQRSNLLTQLVQRRDNLFPALWLYISYAIARTTDATLLETQARATIQGIKDQSQTLTAQLAKDREAAESALAQIRAVAAEQGVSQQAIHFRDEAKLQDDKAAEWLTKTYFLAAGLALLAAASLYLHRLDWISPRTTLEAVQFISSKLIIFSVIGYMLVLSVRSYSSHRHNAVVNKHRQNALLTYRTLVDAAGEKGTQDIVLAHAAACIFAPQETGFTTQKGDASGGAKSVLELMTKTVPKGAE